jgi:hypothetical protein
MKTSLSKLFVATAAALISSTALAQADSQKQAADEQAALAYKPPLRGAPLTRVGGGTRSFGSALAVNVLAPSDTGYTLQEKPTIYWFASHPVDKPVELTITSTESLQDAAKPLLEITLQPPLAKGIHAFRLSDHGVALKPGVEYQWFVAVVHNAAQRSNDVIAGGTIKRVTDSPVQAQLKQASPAQLPAIYAEAGIWYDAIDQLSRQISANQSDRQLRERRAALLEQVGLREAAAFDRGGS